jgi:hypothetical protein
MKSKKENGVACNITEYANDWLSKAIQYKRIADLFYYFFASNNVHGYDLISVRYLFIHAYSG